MIKVSIIGHFAFGLNCLDGQTIKTKIIADELVRHYGENDVVKIDTHGGKWKLLLLVPIKIFKALNQSHNVIVLPAHNGLKIIAPLLVFLRFFFKNKRVHYVVIGGWLPKFLTGRKWLVKTLKLFDVIYVETMTMKNALEQQGFTNIVIMPNCKDLNILKKDQFVYNSNEPYKLCIFSRVNKMKGIEDAVNAVRYVNEKHNRIIYVLDIYGPIEPTQNDWFEELKDKFPKYIRYCGTVPFDQSVNILKNYFALLFTTLYFTEGIPGTIIDAYAAGIPVISSKWESFTDVVDDKVTGFGYRFGDLDELCGLLDKIVINPELVLNLKYGCISKAKDYLPKKAIQSLIVQLND